RAAPTTRPSMRRFRGSPTCSPLSCLSRCARFSSRRKAGKGRRMSDYSVSPLDLLVANQQKGYVGLHIEQGVPLLDRDLNLLHDLIAATVRSVVTRYIGNGIAAGADGFAITALPAGQNSQNFRIAAAGANPGSCLVGG